MCEDTPPPPISRLLENIRTGAHTVLYGPPGTGKSHLITNIGEVIDTSENGYRTIEVNLDGETETWISSTIQFSPNTEESDLLMGIGLNSSNDLVVRPGWLFEFSQYLDDSDFERGIFIIDEMSRADLTLAFGQLFYALEHGGIRLKHVDQAFTLSPKLVIIGTMNTADKNVKKLDIAFRRRFSWVPVMPDYDLIEEWASMFNDDLNILEEEYDFPNRYRRFAEELNMMISNDSIAGPQLQIGQALFFPTKILFDETKENTFSALFEHLRSVLLPQLSHYTNNNSQKLQTWTTQIVSAKLVQYQHITGREIFGLIDVVSNPVND
jgi:hypothetical protein